MVDETDKKILNFLTCNPAITQKEIALALGVTGPAINSRIQRLKQKKIILGTVPVIDLSKIGYSLTVVLMAQAKNGQLEAASQKWAKHPNVNALYRVSGEYDLILVAKFHGTKELDEFNQKMFGDKLIARTNTSLAFSTKKEGQAPNEIR